MSRTFRRAASTLLLAVALTSLVVAGRVPIGSAAHRAADLPTSTPVPVFGPPVSVTVPPSPSSTAPPTASATGQATASSTVQPTTSATAQAATDASLDTPTPGTAGVASPAPTPVLTNPSLPTPVPRPLSFGALDHTIIYDNGSQLALIHADGGGRGGLSFLSANSAKRPRFSGGWQYVYYNNGFWLGDIFGHQQPTAPPAVAGEQVYDAIPSPDGQYIAWQLVLPAKIDGYEVNMGASRIVLTDATGGNAHTLLQQSAGATYGDIPLLYGWRAGHPPTLLVQTSYATRAMLGLHKGLEEFDPTILDLVGDYLPPLGQDTLPQGEVLGVSPSGSTIAYATRDALLPSGEGPFPTNLVVMSANGRHITTIDVATAHKDKATKRLPAPRAYIFFRQAFISPDDSRIAYTRFDILYPRGAIKPYVRPIACLANLDGTGKIDFGPDERVLGWADGHTLVVRRENSHVNGLYAVNLNTGTTKLITLGSGLQVDGIVP